jgi:hypothetical protein
MTLQPGPAPDVKVEGAGLKARVTVGKAVVSFNGQHTVIAH